MNVKKRIINKARCFKAGLFNLYQSEMLEVVSVFSLQSLIDSAVTAASNAVADTERMIAFHRIQSKFGVIH